MELTKSDLLKLVTYFEGEIQARDIAIAALKVIENVCTIDYYLCSNIIKIPVRKIETGCKYG